LKYLVVTLGSAGDLHPFLAVARALAAEGHDVEVMSNAPYEEAVRAEGLAFRPLCSVRDHERTASHADLWDPLRGFGVLWRHLAVPAIEPVRARVMALHEELSTHGSSGRPALRVLASPLAVGARIARMQAPIALCSVYTAPSNLRSVSDPMYLGGWRVPQWVPTPLRRALWWGLDRWKLEPMARPALQAVFAALGIPAPTASTFGEWIHSPEGGITLFPAWFCERQTGWPRVEMGDFPLYRGAGDTMLAPELQAFLEAGPRPVVVFPGSTPGEHGRTLLRQTLTACRALGLRVVALGPTALEERAPGPAEDPEFVHRCAHAPLAMLLPHTSVFVHHGGIGSCAQGLRHRVPQLVRPFAYDQFDNAARVEEEGAGRFVPPGAGARAAILTSLDELSGGGAGAIADHATADGRTEMDRILGALERWESRIRATST
jgi:rhamnosyltransferase subunit B